MARIRIRFEFNKGRKGAPLDRLGEIASQAEKFLRMLALDLRLDVKKGDWTALNFRNGSVGFDVEFHESVKDNQADKFNSGLNYVTSYKSGRELRSKDVSDATVVEYANIGRLVGEREPLRVGVYNGKKAPEWRRITGEESAKIIAELESPIQSFGSVQGLIHSLFKEADPPHFQIRELATEKLIACYYTEDQYAEIAAALKDRSAVVHVTGHVTFDRPNRAIKKLTVEKISVAEPLSLSEFEEFFGSDPNYTGELTTDEYIENLRSGDG